MMDFEMSDFLMCGKILENLPSDNGQQITKGKKSLHAR
jgi:hypothetical protein